MPKRVVRTCLSILMLVYELEFRSSCASYIVVNTIVIFRPLPHDSAPHPTSFCGRLTYTLVPGGNRRWFIVVLIVDDDPLARWAAVWTVAAVEG